MFLDSRSLSESERSAPDGTDERYLQHAGLERLFTDCIGDREGRPLVQPFQSWTDILPYLRFGRLPEEQEPGGKKFAAETEEVAEKKPEKQKETTKAAPGIDKYEDKVPLLGDLPLLGRLFRSDGERSEKTNLLIFVTARLVDPSGRPLRPNEVRGLPDFRR